MCVPTFRQHASTYSYLAAAVVGPEGLTTSPCWWCMDTSGNMMQCNRTACED